MRRMNQMQTKWDRYAVMSEQKDKSTKQSNLLVVSW